MIGAKPRHLLEPTLIVALVVVAAVTALILWW